MFISCFRHFSEVEFLEKNRENAAVDLKRGKTEQNIWNSAAATPTYSPPLSRRIIFPSINKFNVGKLSSEKNAELDILVVNWRLSKQRFSSTSVELTICHFLLFTTHPSIQERETIGFTHNSRKEKDQILSRKKKVRVKYDIPGGRSHFLREMERRAGLIGVG